MIADVQTRIAGKPPVKALVYDSGAGPLGFMALAPLAMR
jgi:hypothetical protein